VTRWHALAERRGSRVLVVGGACSITGLRAKQLAIGYDYTPDSARVCVSKPRVRIEGVQLDWSAAV
jgi:hypothetical protein